MRTILMVVCLLSFFVGWGLSAFGLVTSNPLWLYPGIAGTTILLVGASLEAGLRSRDRRETLNVHPILPPPSPRTVQAYVEGNAGHLRGAQPAATMHKKPFPPAGVNYYPNGAPPLE